MKSLLTGRLMCVSITMLVFLTACGTKGSPTAPPTTTPPPTSPPPPTTPPPPPAVTIGYFAGSVTETPPTAATAVDNVRVEVVDGPNMGKFGLTIPAANLRSPI